MKLTLDPRQWSIPFVIKLSFVVLAVASHHTFEKYDYLGYFN